MPILNEDLYMDIFNSNDDIDEVEDIYVDEMEICDNGRCTDINRILNRIAEDEIDHANDIRDILNINIDSCDCDDTFEDDELIRGNFGLDEKMSEAIDAEVTVNGEKPAYAVINSNGTYAGRFCTSYEEARELVYASGTPGRSIWELSFVEKYNEEDYTLGESYSQNPRLYVAAEEVADYLNDTLDRINLLDDNFVDEADKEILSKAAQILYDFAQDYATDRYRVE